ncbi:MAG: 3-oxo-tetronate kinase [Rhizobiaceae bacterium]
MILGCIGDDFTGSSDLGLTLAEGGMRTIQYCGVPDRPAEEGVDAGIVALKTRTAPKDRAVADSLAALRWLRDQGCRQFFFKICSTFDSTREGNIGPVLDALVEELKSDAPVIICPAFPANGRTVFQGHLFVGDRLISESGMAHHPLTPMTDPDIRRWLSYQTRRGVGHLPLAALKRDAVAALRAERDAGRPFVIADAVSDDDLRALGSASEGLPLLCGGSGLALGLPGVLGTSDRAGAWRGEAGPVLILSGSCSQATRAQVKHHVQAGHPAFKLDIDSVMQDRTTPQAMVAAALAAGPLPLVYSSDDPAEVEAMQARYGREPLADALDRFFGDMAAEAAERGVRRIVCAGGETSGAIVQALGAASLEIGPAIDPGVPMVRVAGRPLVLALKSGNFGAPDFFARAATMLESR